MAITLSLVGAGVGALSGGINAFEGAKQKKAANAALANNVMPQYQIPQTEWDNLNQLQSQAGQGLSDSSRTVYNNAAGQGLGASISAIQRGGGDVNTLGGAFNSYLNNTSQLALADDKMKNQHMADLIGGRQRISADQDKEYQINKYSPWANRQQALTQQVTAAANKEQAGFNQATNSVMNGLSSVSGILQGNTKKGQDKTVQNNSAPGSMFDYANSYGFHAPMATDQGVGGQTLSDYPSYMGMNAGQKSGLYNNWLQFQQ